MQNETHENQQAIKDSNSIARLDERTMQITKTLDTMADRFEGAVEKLQTIMVKLSADTTAQLLAHTLKEEEVWRDFRQANEQGHRDITVEIDKKIEPISERITVLEKIIYKWGGIAAAALFVITLFKDVIIKFLFGSQ